MLRSHVRRSSDMLAAVLALVVCSRSSPARARRSAAAPPGPHRHRPGRGPDRNEAPGDRRSRRRPRRSSRTAKPADACSGTSAAGRARARDRRQLGRGLVRRDSRRRQIQRSRLQRRNDPRRDLELQLRARSGPSGSTTRTSEVGVCEAELQPGDQVLLFPCLLRRSDMHRPNPLAIEAPRPPSVGEPVHGHRQARTPQDGTRSARGGRNASRAAAQPRPPTPPGHAPLALRAGRQRRRSRATRARTRCAPRRPSASTTATTAPAARTRARRRPPARLRSPAARPSLRTRARSRVVASATGVHRRARLPRGGARRGCSRARVTAHTARHAR